MSTGKEIQAEIEAMQKTAYLLEKAINVANDMQKQAQWGQVATAALNLGRKALPHIKTVAKNPHIQSMLGGLGFGTLMTGTSNAITNMANNTAMPQAPEAGTPESRATEAQRIAIKKPFPKMAQAGSSLVPAPVTPVTPATPAPSKMRNIARGAGHFGINMAGWTLGDMLANKLVPIKPIPPHKFPTEQ